MHDRAGFTSWRSICGPNIGYNGELMAIDQILALLVAERDKLTAAIQALQGPTRIGRPPKNVSALPANGVTTPKRRKPMSAAKRKALSAKLRAAWVKRKKAPAAVKNA